MHDQAIVATPQLQAIPSQGIIWCTHPRVEEICSGTAAFKLLLIHQSDCRQKRQILCRTWEFLHQRTCDDYPNNLASEYHLINEYKSARQWNLHHPILLVWLDWGEIGHICPNCPVLKDDDNKERDVERADSPPKSTKESKSNNKKNETSFPQLWWGQGIFPGTILPTFVCPLIFKKFPFLNA